MGVMAGTAVTKARVREALAELEGLTRVAKALIPLEREVHGMVDDPSDQVEDPSARIRAIREASQAGGSGAPDGDDVRPSRDQEGGNVVEMREKARG